MSSQLILNIKKRWINACIFLLCFIIIKPNLFARNPDTINLKETALTEVYSLKRDVDITLFDLSHFRCELLYIDSVRCVVRLASQKSKAASNYILAPHLDTTLGKTTYILPLSEVSVISFWKTRNSLFSEAPFGIGAFATFITPFVGLITTAPAFPIVIVTGTSAVISIWGFKLQKPKRYLLNKGLLIYMNN